MVKKRKARKKKKADIKKTFNPIHLSFIEINCERTTTIKMRLNERFKKLNFDRINFFIE